MKTVPLKSVARYGKDKVESNSLTPENYISTENLIPNRGGKTLSSYTPQSGKSSLFRKGDILVSNIRPYFKKIWFAKLPGGCSNDVLVFKVDESIAFPKYAFYALSTDHFFDFMMAGSNGTKMPRGNKKSILNYPIFLPEIKEQKKIASILSAYDDLIENNLKRIKLLEEKAQLTYEEWFVRMKYPGHENDVVDSETGLPKGWTKYMLSEAANFLNGYAFKPKDLVEKGYPVIKIKEMKNGVVSDTPRNSGDLIDEKYLVNKGDILFSWSATLEVIIWKEETGLLNQHLFKVTPKEPFKRSYVYLACKNALKQFELLTTGATMKHIKRKELDFVTANFPGARLMSSFEKEVEPLLEAMVRLKESIGQLNMAKDVLLPRLMSGMIDIDEIKYNYPKEILE